MFRFAAPEWFYALLFLPVFWLSFWIVRKIRKSSMKKLGNPSIIQSLLSDYSPGREFLRIFLYTFAFAAIILTLARPQFGTKLTEVKRKGVEIIIALDVSNSMLATDIQPNRLDRAKQAISALLDQLSNDRIGLIVFAGEAYTQVPVTTDYVSVRMFLETLEPQMIATQGTAIGAAIRLAMNSFDPNSQLEKALIIISDGENHEDDAADAAKEATNKGIMVHTIGIGNPNGVPIPIPGTNGTQFRKDTRGEVVITKLDEKVLSEIASIGGGSYTRATNARLGLSEVFRRISGMEKKEYESKVYTEFDEKYMFPAWLALVLVLFDLMLMDKRNRFLSRWNIFKMKL